MAGERRTTTIGALMTVVLIVALALAFPRLVEEPWFWWAVLAWVVGSRWIRAPIGVHRTNAFPVEKDYLPFDPSAPDVPGAIADRFRRATADLESLGFGLRGYFRPDRHSPLVIGQVGIYEDPRSGEVAKLVVAATRTKVTATLALFAKFADGTELVTSDNTNLPNWPSPPWMIGQAFPGIRDASALLAVHRPARPATAARPSPPCPPTTTACPPTSARRPPGSGRPRSRSASSRGTTSRACTDRPGRGPA